MNNPAAWSLYEALDNLLQEIAALTATIPTVGWIGSRRDALLQEYALISASLRRYLTRHRASTPTANSSATPNQTRRVVTPENLRNILAGRAFASGIMSKPGPKTRSKPKTLLGKPSPDALDNEVADLRGLLESRLFADVKLKCQNGEIIEAHKCILVARCEYFKSAFDDSFGFKEATSNAMEFPENSHYAVRSLVEWVYGCDYDYRLSSPNGSFAMHFEVFTLAMKLSVPELCDLAKGKAQAMDEIDPADFCRSVGCVYDQPAVKEFNEWKELLIAYASKHGKFLHATQENSSYREIIVKQPQFLLELADKMIPNGKAKNVASNSTNS